ncbi:UNVERIFIED_CONTAM: hypothetical protein PYX00_011816 [Menopon gallinae]|uniref:DNA-directed RNA polymerase RpoA/D/Rpb3-type domain-containing protein n=1 Tax=Menopon gallinae TaxID=328185 RepID=A0AAW2H8Q7_9NEOP
MVPLRLCLSFLFVIKLCQASALCQHLIDRTTHNEALSQIKLELVRREGNHLEFDMINTDCSVANALRRILISEIPTLAVEKVLIHKNSGVMPDETLAHRLGLIPIEADPEDVDGKELESLAFRIDVKNGESGIMNVYSHDIQCVQPSRRPWFKKNVLITRLAPKQEIEVEMFCSKGTGKEHAKWSPVCPATYRLMPDIQIEDVYDDDAVKLQSLFKDGVVGIQAVNGRKKAYVKNPRLDFMSREVLRHKEFDGRVYIGRVPNHFIFTIESVSIDPVVLLKRAIAILLEKARCLREDILNKDY